MNEKIADFARQEVGKFYHGYVCGTEANLHEIIKYFPAWDLRRWDNHWGAAFVYHCCALAKFPLDIRFYDSQVSYSFANTKAWEQWAMLPEVNRFEEYVTGMNLEPGDIILVDSVFEGVLQDRIGIILEDREDYLLVAEGNFNNISAIVTRKKDNHIRAVIHMNN